MTDWMVILGGIAAMWAFGTALYAVVMAPLWVME